MLAMDKITREHFEALTGRGTRAVDNEIDKGQLLYWMQPPAEARASGKRFPRTFIALDAVLVTLTDLFVEGGLRREAISLALPGMQLVLPAGVDRQNTLMVVAIARNNRLSAGCGTMDELREMDLFVGKSHSHSWRLSIAPAVERVRERAKERGIDLPARFAPDEAPQRVRGAEPAWKFSTKDGGTTSAWSPTHRFVQIPAMKQ